MTGNSAFAAAAMALVLVLAGCSAAPGIGSDTATSGAADGGAGSIDFYISDEPNDIDDFEHLNVTISRVGLHRVGEGEATAEPGTAVTVTPAEDNETETETEERETNETDEEDDADDGEWVEYEVNKTVDLTRLVGENATRLDVLEAPAGTYDKVFIYVSDINATLKNGESTEVKLPSERLHINTPFQVENGSNVSFVFDIAVHQAGQSGQYILRPVVSQSGTDVPINDVGERDERAEDRGDRNETDRDDGNETDRNESTDENESDASELSASFQGRVAAGESATLLVTDDNGPVENATVTVNGEVVGETGADGTVTFTVPEGAEELTVLVEAGENQLEFERDVGGDGAVATVA